MMVDNLYRNYSRIDGYLHELSNDVYPQPEDEGHLKMAMDVIDSWKEHIRTCRTVLDVGCGEGFCQPLFESLGTSYTGVSLGDDLAVAWKHNRNVIQADFSFLEFPDNFFDFVFSRHSLEHSPMPLLTLMEWHRVGTKYLGLVLPKPDYWKFGGRNHYFVLSLNQVRVLLARAGWNPIRISMDKDNEYRVLCEKAVRPLYGRAITSTTDVIDSVEQLDLEAVEWHSI